MADTDNTPLKEALCTQQQLLQKLYYELDVEREASATAASEALSMILRLQGEKAAVQMEAEQYKRLAEEKMFHAEESITMFEDLIYQKEMEIASLEYQVQAYRYKLLSLGYSDQGVGELVKSPDHLLQGSEAFVGETSAESALRRRNSAPPKIPKLSYYKKGRFVRERSLSPEAEIDLKRVEENEDCHNVNIPKKKQADSVNGDNNSYWEQINSLDKRVKAMAGEQYAKLRCRSRSSSPFSQLSSNIVCDTENESDTEKLLEGDAISDTNCSSRVHDVFEVPQTVKNIGSSENWNKGEEESVLQCDERARKSDSSWCEDVESHAKAHAITMEKKIFSSKLGEIDLCRPVNCSLAIVQPSVAVVETQPEHQQMNMTTEITEADRPEPIRRGEDERKLLTEIREQLNSIQSEIRSLKRKETSQFDLPMLSITEAMLHFWL